MSLKERVVVLERTVRSMQIERELRPNVTDLFNSCTALDERVRELELRVTKSNSTLLGEIDKLVVALGFESFSEQAKSGYRKKKK